MSSDITTEESPVYFPDDGKTRIYYEKIEDDLLTALMENNKERTDWIISRFRIGKSTINMCYVECFLKNRDMAAYLDKAHNIDDDVKAQAKELAALPPWVESYPFTETEKSEFLLM